MSELLGASKNKGDMDAIRDLLSACRPALTSDLYPLWHRLETSVATEPTNPLSLYHLADTCRALGRLDLWKRVVREAFALPHTHAEQIFARARAKLTLGDWSGWRDYEARHARSSGADFRQWFIGQLNDHQSEWQQSEDVSRRTVLLYAEHSFGSSIQMLRYLPVVARRAEHVVVAVKPELVSLIQHNFGEIVSVTLSDFVSQTQFDRWLFTMSLPSILEILPELRLTSCTRAQLDSSGPRQQRRGGICWAGSSTNRKSHLRSIPIAELAPLLGRPDTEWYNLYVGPRMGDAAAYAQIRQPTPPLFTFAQTAALIETLDYVVTVDTSIAHLAAGLGVPTFVLLHSEANWRWGLNDTTPWYPSARLIRQRYADDWAGVVVEVSRRLDEWV